MVGQEHLEEYQEDCTDPRLPSGAHLRLAYLTLRPLPVLREAIVSAIRAESIRQPI